MALLLNHDDVTLRLIKDVRDIQAAMRKRDSLLPLFYVQNENAPAQITANQDNYSPGNYDVLLLSSSASFSISGISGGVQGRLLQIFNTGNYLITLLYESGSSLPQNRFLFQNGLPATLEPGTSINLYYHNAVSRWIAGIDVPRTTIAGDANDIFRCNSCDGSGWTGTINGAPAGAVVTYTHVSGNKNSLVPAATTQLGKQRLYNTTRGNYALISTSNGTTTITLTANAPANWVNGDTITTLSPTVVNPQNNVDIEIVSGSLLGASQIGISALINNTSAAGGAFRFHPFEAFSLSKQQQVIHQVVNIPMSSYLPCKLTSNVFSINWDTVGSAAATIVIRQVSYTL